MSKQPTGMIIGQKGTQYGLQKVVPKKPIAATGAAGAVVQRKAVPTNVFGDDDSEEEDVERQIARQADKKRAAAKVQQMYEEALAQDPSIFNYDGTHDAEARAAPKQQEKVQRQSKYIASLLEQAQDRKREQDVLYERRMVRERQQEDHLFEDKERFVTSAYRRKLEEDKKWQEAERQRELEEQRNDVRKVGHMGNFYANLLTKNVAYGTAQPAAAAAAAGDTLQQDQHTEEEVAAAGAQATKGDGAGEERGGSRAASPEAADGAGREGSASATEEGRAGASSAAAQKVLAHMDRYDVLRLEAERALREKKLREQQQQEQGQRQEQRQGHGQEEPASGDAAPEGAAQQHVQRQQQGSEERPGPRSEARGSEGGEVGRKEGGRTEGTSGKGADVEARAAGTGDADAAGAAAGKRRNDETAVQSAKERYLARKQQRTG